MAARLGAKKEEAKGPGKPLLSRKEKKLRGTVAGTE